MTIIVLKVYYLTVSSTKLILQLLPIFREILYFGRFIDLFEKWDPKLICVDECSSDTRFVGITRKFTNCLKSLRSKKECQYELHSRNGSQVNFTWRWLKNDNFQIEIWNFSGSECWLQVHMPILCIVKCAPDSVTMRLTFLKWRHHIENSIFYMNLFCKQTNSTTFKHER